MAEVVRQANGFDQVFVRAQRAGNGAPDLGHFQGVGEAGAVIIALVVDEYLGFIFQAAESRGVKDAVAVALKSGAVIGFMVRELPPLALFAVQGIGSEASILVGFQ